MKVILANPRGFCAGVNMAIDVVDQLLDICPDETICVYHEIVHNQHVVSRFKDRGVLFVESIDEVPDDSIVVFSAHGVSPKIRQEASARNLTAVDATCPLVTKVHAEAIRYSKRGWQILLVGHADHQEVIGTRGEAPDAIQIVESPEDIPDLRIDDPEKVVYLTQTTLSTDDANVIIDALKAAIPTIKSPPSEDICYATTNRQKAVRAIAPDCDLVLVIGSRNSSNSVRLTEIAENVGTRARLIDDVGELEHDWFEQVDNVLVTAGASAPDDLVNDLVLHLVETFGGDVEQRDIDRETVEFGLPGSLKSVMRDHGVDPAGRRMLFDRAGDLDAVLDQRGIPHRTVDLTIGASE
ncbi:MAG: 4-hydroxy-3-methylbut-2-enyl diphosphate reductase [Planctomycetota bacterium]|nr:4-hydroxy-3-methylbut-2-enyl diphosphate reductase [Planctomycetota bacterium]